MPANFPRALFWKLQTAGWVLYAAALIVPWLGYYTIQSMLPNKAVIAGSGLLVSSGLREVYRRLLQRRTKGATLLAVVVIASVVAGIVWYLAAAAMLGGWPHQELRILGTITDGIPRFDGILHHALVMMTWSLAYLGAAYSRDLVLERERSLRSESLAREARLSALRHQINPHFLFNSLNAVSTLIVTNRGSEATAMLADVAGLMRSSLERGEASLVPLSTEMEFVSRYLRIEGVRFGDRLDVSVAVDAEAAGALVPPMILQPILENSIRYAVGMRDTTTRIEIRGIL